MSVPCVIRVWCGFAGNTTPRIRGLQRPSNLDQPKSSSPPAGADTFVEPVAGGAEGAAEGADELRD